MEWRSCFLARNRKELVVRTRSHEDSWRRWLLQSRQHWHSYIKLPTNKARFLMIGKELSWHLCSRRGGGGGGGKSKGSNYRPVSLTSCCCKVMEYIVHSHPWSFWRTIRFWATTSLTSGKIDLVRLSSSPLYMTSQLDWTDGNTLMQFCWISTRLLIRFAISALQSSSITMASETKTYPGSKAFSRIEISKWSLMGRHHLVLLSHPEFHKAQCLDLSCSWYTSMTCPQEFPLQYDFLLMIVYCTESYETNRMQRHYRQILIIHRNGKENGKWILTQTNANTSGSPTSERSSRLPTTLMDRPWMKILKPSTLESL